MNEDREVLKLVGARIRALRKEEGIHRNPSEKRWISFFIHRTDRTWRKECFFGKPRKDR